MSFPPNLIKPIREQMARDGIGSMMVCIDLWGGDGDIDVMEPPNRRCTYCTCGGWLTVQSFIVDDAGITEERDLSDECAWEDD